MSARALRSILLLSLAFMVANAAEGSENSIPASRDAARPIDRSLAPAIGLSGLVIGLFFRHRARGEAI